MRILLWNVQWNSTRRRQRFILDTLRAESPSVFCLTEATDFFAAAYPHTFSSTADYGYSHGGDRRKVWLASTEPWAEAEYGENTNMPPGRFVSGVTHGVRFVGVCVPWSGAHVTTGRRDRKRWEDHVAFLRRLGPLLGSYARGGTPVCVLGDFNQRVPASTSNAKYVRYLEEALGEDYTIHTAGLLDVDGEPLIDHIATTPQLGFELGHTIGRRSPTGGPISDHPGICGELTSR